MTELAIFKSLKAVDEHISTCILDGTIYLEVVSRKLLIYAINLNYNIMSIL